MSNFRNIKLTRGAYSKIDNDDLLRVSKHKWYLHDSKPKKDNYSQYAQATINGKSVYLHRFILNAKQGQIVDHINHDGLDNRKENLRFCFSGLNQANRKMSRNNKSGFRGVRWVKANKKWVAKIRVNNKCFHLGLFESKRDAVIAYNAVARFSWGRYAELNPIPTVEDNEKFKQELVGKIEGLKAKHSKDCLAQQKMFSSKGQPAGCVCGIQIHNTTIDQITYLIQEE